MSLDPPHDFGKPVVALTTYALAESGPRPAAFAGSRSYVQAVVRCGGLPILLPTIEPETGQLGTLLRRCDGLILTGGPDVDPAIYGEAKRPYCGHTDPLRDQYEMELLRLAESTRLPVLAICRGLQILNVAVGGTLHQGIREEVPACIGHDQGMGGPSEQRGHPIHEVNVVPGTRLADIFPDGLPTVNSLHHQAVKDLGPGLKPSAFAPDGVIEAAETVEDRFLLAVQWHPEEMIEERPEMLKLFQAFVDACSSRRPSTLASW